MTCGKGLPLHRLYGERHRLLRLCSCPSLGGSAEADQHGHDGNHRRMQVD